MKRTILIFTALIVALLSLLKLSTYGYNYGNISIEIIISAVAVLFFLVGVYLNKKSLRKKSFPLNEIDKKRITQLGLSNREYEILHEVSIGLSNKEIAEKLYVSESTIKTHISNILLKLDAKRRTQAVQKAKEFGILVF